MKTLKRMIGVKDCKILLIGIIGLMLFCHVSETAFSQPSDVLTVACVNFRTDWGNKEANLNRVMGYLEAAAKRGADIILFPETALTGYDIDEEVIMHRENAETIPGPSTNKIAQLTRKYGVYAIVGMAEKDKDDSEIIYNSVAIVGPEGVIDSYAKIHPAFTENKWCKKGKRPVLFETPWGPVGVGICYDTTMFPELPRYYAACGARL
jgi:predicted amidohydrolase